MVIKIYFQPLEIIAMSKIFLEKILNEEIRVSFGHVGILQEVIQSFELSEGLLYLYSKI
ncbi:MAG: hypothetical protein Ct9H90mP2_01720 [Dehalococcoidia bacterium]|nr:MAG: hypothetical protein Ct9H90mP2_01720 [Dehalococcoidia bacterium]